MIKIVCSRYTHYGQHQKKGEHQREQQQHARSATDHQPDAQSEHAWHRHHRREAEQHGAEIVESESAAQ